MVCCKQRAKNEGDVKNGRQPAQPCRQCLKPTGPNPPGCGIKAFTQTRQEDFTVLLTFTASSIHTIVVAVHIILTYENLQLADHFPKTPTAILTSESVTESSGYQPMEIAPLCE
eukprot:4469281-Amphidinium_carterae.1